MVLTDQAGPERWWLRARWWILAGFASAVGGVGLVAWAMARDQRWVAAARRHCAHLDFPALPDNSAMGWAVVVLGVVAVLAVVAGAVLHARAAGWHVGARMVGVLVALLAVLVASALVLLGLIMIEPRHLSTGVDGSGLPCPAG